MSTAISREASRGHPVTRFYDLGSPLRGPSGRAWTWIAWLTVVMSVGVNLYVAASAYSPSFPFDEISQLQMSRMLAGFDTPHVRGAGYYPGWSFLIAPLWWFTDDPATVYRASIFIGVAVVTATLWPLSRLISLLGLNPAQSLTVAAIVLATPSRALQSDYVMSEKLLFFFVAAAFWAAWSLWIRPRWYVAALFSLSLAAVLFTHARMLPMVAAGAVWLLLFLRRDWRVGMVGLLTLAPLAWAAQVGGAQLNIDLLGGFTQGEGALDDLADSRPSLFARVGLGQSWIQVVGSFGLIMIGFAVSAVMTGRELRRFRVGPGGWLLGATIATWLVSLMSWAKDESLFNTWWPRLDVWIYGRYVDPVTSIVVAVGLAFVIRRATSRPILTAIAGSVALFVPVYLWLAPQATTWGYVTPAHIPGAMPWHWALPTERFPAGVLPTLTNENRFWLIPMVCTLIVLILIWVFRRWTRSLTVGLALLFTAATVVANGASDRFQELEGPKGEVATAIDAIEEANGPLRIGYDRGCSRPGFFGGVSQNVVSYWALPAIVEEVNRQEQSLEQMNVDLVVGCDDGWEQGRDAGALRYNDATDRHSVIWVLPGAIQDRLVADGLVD